MPYKLFNTLAKIFQVIFVEKINKMHTAILYASSHGTSRKVAELLSSKIHPATTEIIDLKKTFNFNPEKYDAIVIGGSIHAGNIQSAVKKFCKNHESTLLQKPLGLYLCGMNVPDYDKQFDNAFPDSLKKVALFKENVGGEFLMDKMNFIERFIIKKVSKVTETVSKIDEGKIDSMAEKLSKIR